MNPKRVYGSYYLNRNYSTQGIRRSTSRWCRWTGSPRALRAARAAAGSEVEPWREGLACKMRCGREAKAHEIPAQGLLGEGGGEGLEAGGGLAQVSGEGEGEGAG